VPLNFFETELAEIALCANAPTGNSTKIANTARPHLNNMWSRIIVPSNGEFEPARIPILGWCLEDDPGNRNGAHD
jgi:hypothetical protein